MADFEVFRPAGATRCTDGVKYGMEEVPSSMPNFTPSVQREGCIGVGPQKLKFLLRFDQNVEYKRPAGAYTLRDFQNLESLCRISGCVKILLDLLTGLWSYGGF